MNTVTLIRVIKTRSVGRQLVKQSCNSAYSLILTLPKWLKLGVFDILQRVLNRCLPICITDEGRNLDPPVRVRVNKAHTYFVYSFCDCICELMHYAIQTMRLACDY